jgi:serine/threonine protein kinase
MESVSPSSEARPTLATGQVVGGRFEVESEVEDGPLGKLYRARDQKTGRAVALRLASPSIFGRPETATLLREECRTIAKLQHRSLALTFGVGQVAGAQFVATDWVEGENLTAYAAQRAKRKQPLTLEGAYNVVAHVLKALERLHEATCHGAVSPASIRVTDVGRVQLTDAGVALAAIKAGGAECLGSDARGFLAPEVLEGGLPTRSSDVYGAGAVLFHLLTGRLPIDGFMPPSMLNPEASPPLDDALLQCLDRDPAKRFASVADLRRALQPIAVGMQADLAQSDVALDIDVGDRVSKPPVLASAPPAEERVSVIPLDEALLEEVTAEDAEALVDADIDVGSVKSAAAINLPYERASLSPFAPVQAAPAQQAAARGHAAPAPHGATAARETTARATTGRAGHSDLKEIVSKITENDALRWMVVKDGLDHGPFSGRDLIQRIVKGEVVESQIVSNMETGQRGPLVAFDLFGPFIEQQKLHHKEAEQLVAVKRSESSEKRRNSVVMVGGAVLMLGIGLGVWFGIDRLQSANRNEAGEVDGEIYKGGNIELDETGKPRRGRKGGGGRRGRGGAVASGGGGGGGAGLSYEDAMNQAVNLGDVSSGGAMTQLSRDDIKATMDRQLASFQGCVNQETARGGALGRVSMNMAIMGDGSVQGVSVSAGSDAFKQCIAGRVRSVRFPSFSAPRMGATYAFDL